MSGMDVIVTALVAVAAALAVRSVWRERKGGGCSGCCRRCENCGQSTQEPRG